LDVAKDGAFLASRWEFSEARSACRNLRCIGIGGNNEPIVSVFSWRKESLWEELQNSIA
jgi:hypothetical protein